MGNGGTGLWNLNSLLPNTIPRARAEGLHRVQLVVGELVGVEEPLGLEGERVAEVALAVVHRQLRHAHDGALGHEVAGDVGAALGHDAGQRACYWGVAAEAFAEAGEHCGGDVSVVR